MISCHPVKSFPDFWNVYSCPSITVFPVTFNPSALKKYVSLLISFHPVTAFPFSSQVVSTFIQNQPFRFNFSVFFVYAIMPSIRIRCRIYCCHSASTCRQRQNKCNFFRVLFDKIHVITSTSTRPL